jgi:hypothetical protein
MAEERVSPDWLTGPRWETFHLAELRRILERDYRANPVMAVVRVDGRLGALAYAARHPACSAPPRPSAGSSTRLNPAVDATWAWSLPGEDPGHLWATRAAFCRVDRAQPV